MRDRERILQSLERVYRDAFAAAETSGDATLMARLDLDYQRDQLQLEALLDIRDLLLPESPKEETTKSLLEKAQHIRRLTKLRP
jgi:hypothetical protein